MREALFLQVCARTEGPEVVPWGGAVPAVTDKTAHDTPPRVVLATDFSEASGAATRAAFAYARLLGARLSLLHVTRERGRVAARQRLARLVRELGPDLPTETVVSSGLPAEEIVRHAAERKAGLLVVGTHGRTGVSRVLLGSVSERVARTSPCPVLVVPAAPAEAAPARADVFAEAQTCLVCDEPSPDLVCENCRARLRRKYAVARDADVAHRDRPARRA
jgi:nucleotide-binding universal stress UspA family protein